MAHGVSCTEYPERVSGHVGRGFVDTSSAVHLTGGFRIVVVQEMLCSAYVRRDQGV
jgi:hypothetical protein